MYADWNFTLHKNRLSKPGVASPTPNNYHIIEIQWFSESVLWIRPHKPQPVATIPPPASLSNGNVPMSARTYTYFTKSVNPTSLLTTILPAEPQAEKRSRQSHQSIIYSYRVSNVTNFPSLWFLRSWFVVGGAGDDVFFCHPDYRHANPSRFPQDNPITIKETSHKTGRKEARREGREGRVGVCWLQDFPDKPWEPWERKGQWGGKEGKFNQSYTHTCATCSGALRWQKWKSENSYIFIFDRHTARCQPAASEIFQ